MKEIIESTIEFLKLLVQNSSPLLSIIVGMGIIILESIIPVLPLAVFIAINMLVFGNVVGFIISWIATILGCILSFYIFRKGFSNILYKNIEKRTNIVSLMKRITNIKFSTLVLITAMPFTPAFSINIAAGLSKISSRKFILAIIIAKIAIVYFWGFVGSTLLESITDPKVIAEIIIILLGAYLISRLINKKFHIE